MYEPQHLARSLLIKPYTVDRYQSHRSHIYRPLSWHTAPSRRSLWRSTTGSRSRMSKASGNRIRLQRVAESSRIIESKPYTPLLSPCQVKANLLQPDSYIIQSESTHVPVCNFRNTRPPPKPTLPYSNPSPSQRKTLVNVSRSVRSG